MPLLTSQPISGLAVELLRRQLVLVNTVSRVPAPDYAGPSGGSVTLRVPLPRTARQQATKSAAITYDAVDEVPVSVTLTHWYNGAFVSDEDLSHTIEDFGRQHVLPAVVAVAEAAENQLADAMNGLTPDATIAWGPAPDPDFDKQTVLDLRERLTANGCPPGSRYVAAAPDVTTRLLNIPGFVEADKRGATSAIDQAIVGMVYGLTFVESAAVDAGTAVGYHSSGLTFANVAPAEPGGGADSTISSSDGVSLRHVLAFDPGHLSTASVVSVFAGAAVVPENAAGTVIKRAIRVDTQGS